MKSYLLWYHVVEKIKLVVNDLKNIFNYWITINEYLIIKRRDLAKN